jgi:ATP/ADP translocase/HEAT repeat protein
MAASRGAAITVEEGQPPAVDSNGRSVLETLFRVQRGEERRAAVLFVQLLAASGVFVLGRTARDALFLSRFSAAALPWMFIGYGVVSAAVAVVYGRWADRLARTSLIYFSAAVGALTYVGVWFVIRGGASWIYPAFYIATEVIANLLILQFWTFESELENPRDARRLNTTIAAARPVGTIVFGVTAGAVVRRVGTEQLLFVLALLSLVFAACAWVLRHEPRAAGEPSHGHAGEGERRVVPVAYLRVLTLLIGVMFLALTLGDYQFKIIASRQFAEDDLARFFGLFYGVTGLLAAGFQVFVTPRILSQFGVGPALSAMPALFGTSSLLLYFYPGLAAASTMKFADNGLQFTLHDTTMQSLYAPFPARERARLRGLFDGAIKPLSYSLGGAVLLLLGHFQISLALISLFTFVVAAAWQALVHEVRRQYLLALEMGLAGPVPAGLFDEPFVVGAAEERLLLRSLESHDPVLVLLALEHLGDQRSSEVRRSVSLLLKRPEPAVRARAIRFLERAHHHPAIADLRLAAGDADPSVRAAAAGALARLLGNEYPEQALPLMDDRSREVRITATANLIRYGGILASTRAGERLLGLQSSPEPDRRREACAVLSHLGKPAYRLLEDLLHDPVPEVRRAALRAASRNADPRFVPLMVAALRTPSLRTTALAGLIAAGRHSVPFIDDALRSAQLPRAVRLELPRTLSTIPVPGAMDALRRHMNDHDSHFRLRVYAAMGRLRRRLALPPMPEKELSVHLRKEIVEACTNLLGWAGARARFETPLLKEEMAFRTRRAERRILRLLELRYDRRETVVILEALETPARRSEALEALDALLSGDMREWVLPFLDRGERIAELPFLQSAPVHPPGPVEFMLQQVRHENPYVRALALDSLSRVRVDAAVPAAHEALSHPDPRVREAGLRALGRLEPAAASVAAGLSGDPVPWVARLATAIVSSPPPANAVADSLEDLMYGTVEKIAFLKSTPLFSALSGEDLSPLAAAAEVRTAQPGETVFVEGDPGDHFYIIISGSVKLESGDRELKVLGVHQAFGELALFDRSRQHCSARAAARCELLRIGAEEFFQVLREQPEIAESLLGIFAAEVRRLQQAASEQARQAAPPTIR